MTHSLSRAAEQFLKTEPVLSVSSVLRDATAVPSMPGIYGWWFDPAFLPDQTGGILVQNGLRLLYVGIAPSRPATTSGQGARTLRDRLKNHCRGPIRTSTLRRTLAAVLATEEGFIISRLESGKVSMSASDEQRLSGWMDGHAKIAYMAAQAPWSLEAELLAWGPSLPLNISGSRNPFRHQLKALRRGSQ